MSEAPRLRYGSLFTGIGGFDLAMDRAGFDCAWQVEIDDAASAVLRRHWPEVDRHNDICVVGADNLAAVDVIVGGFPCQDVSVAGQRKGFAGGTRSSLWWEMHRVIKETRPSWLVIENVPGLLSSHRGRDFAAVIASLDELGYVGAWRVLDAQYWGVAQRRRRVFLVGCLGGDGAREILFEPDGLCGDTSQGATAREELATALTGRSSNDGINRPGRSRAETYGDNLVAAALTQSAGHHGRSSPRGDGSDNLIPAYALKGDGQPKWDGADNLVVGPLDAVSANRIGAHHPRHDLDNETYVFSLRGREGGSVPEVSPDGTVPLLGQEDQHNRTLIAPALRPANESSSHAYIASAVLASYAKTADNGFGPQNVVLDDPPSEHEHALTAHAAKGGDPTTDEYVVAWDERNITSPGNRSNPQDGDPCCTLHQEPPSDAGRLGIRRLTPTECERLQGFPDGWTAWGMDAKGKRTEMSDSARYRQLGNAVAVPVLEWLAARLGRRWLEQQR